MMYLVAIMILSSRLVFFFLEKMENLAPLQQSDSATQRLGRLQVNALTLRKLLVLQRGLTPRHYAIFHGR